ncbi:hypothetical protein NYR61_02655 [Actinobacillus genomosp. 1]|uniref:hypothetical protein n=1 Tax=Actinobacillus genomosp. 1 TaxID=254839 RepID=UPI0024414B51|nr:hypothetical protein [Actinobacillus genomosp. 1]WGE34477.1 hypothetical protein NYR61_02655 [Actinobacillus genomosp. 1]
MKKLIIPCTIAFFLAGCTVAEFNKFIQSTTETKQTQHKSKVEKQTSSTGQVIRIKKNPNKGKKRANVGGMEMPSQFSYDEDGDLQFTPKTSDRDIREYNRILQRTGIRVEGY